MELVDIVAVVTRMSVGAIATFFAILVWSKTRDVAWILVVVATMVAYAQFVIGTLEQFGLISTDGYRFAGLPVFELVLANLPGALTAVAFIVLLARRRMF